jgi:O-antigen ligase
VTVGRFHHRRKLRDLLLAALLAALVYKSQSRAGALGAAVGVVAFYAGYFGRKLWIVALAVVIGAMAYILYTDVAKAQRGKAEGLSLLQQAQDNFMRGEKDAGEYGSGRIPLWLSAYERWKLAPFLGHGFKTAGDVYYSGTDVPVRYHSSFVQIGSELGTVGLLFFFAPIVYSGIKSLKGTVKKGAGRMRDHAVVAALAAGWFGGVVDSCFESWLFAVGNVGTVLAWTCFFAGMKGLSQEDLYDELDGEGAGEPEEDDENVFYGFLPREKRQLTGGGRYVQ